MNSRNQKYKSRHTTIEARVVGFSLGESWRKVLTGGDCPVQYQTDVGGRGGSR